MILHLEKNPHLETERGEAENLVRNAWAEQLERAATAPQPDIAVGASITAATTADSLRHDADPTDDPLASRAAFIERARQLWPKLTDEQRASLQAVLPELAAIAE